MDIAAYQNMRISTRGKRPLRNLTPDDKVRAIQRIHNGETKASVSRDIGVPESTLRGWCKNEQKLRFMCRQMGGSVGGISSEQCSLEKPPEKRAKTHVDPYESYQHSSYDINRLDVRNSVNSKIDKNCSFISSNFVNDLMKKNGYGYDVADKLTASSTDSNPFLQGMSALNAATSFPQMPLLSNAHLLSLLNPNLAQPLPPLLLPANSQASCHYDDNVAKIPLRTLSNTTNNDKPKKEKTSAKSASTLAVKNFANESLLSHKQNGHGNPIDNKNDTNNNAVRSALAKNAELSEFPAHFPLGLPLPAVPTTMNLDTDARNNAILQWTKVFNASLNFLALAAAATAVQPSAPQPPPTTTLTTEVPEVPSSTYSESSDTALYYHDELEIGSTHPLVRSLDHDDDSNFESEPEDLSVRSVISKLSSSPQTPSRELTSDSSST